MLATKAIQNKSKCIENLRPKSKETQDLRWNANLQCNAKQDQIENKMSCVI